MSSFHVKEIDQMIEQIEEDFDQGSLKMLKK